MANACMGVDDAALAPSAVGPTNVARGAANSDCAERDAASRRHSRFCSRPTAASHPGGHRSAPSRQDRPGVGAKERGYPFFCRELLVSATLTTILLVQIHSRLRHAAKQERRQVCSSNIHCEYACHTAVPVVVTGDVLLPGDQLCTAPAARASALAHAGSKDGASHRQCRSRPLSFTSMVDHADDRLSFFSHSCRPNLQSPVLHSHTRVI